MKDDKKIGAELCIRIDKDLNVISKLRGTMTHIIETLLIKEILEISDILISTHLKVRHGVNMDNNHEIDKGDK